MCRRASTRSGRARRGRRRRPDEPSEIERHGTEMAGILVGSGGPAGFRGVATGATMLPIRVAGWQLDAHGKPAVYARTDQLLAGLERAVDPNGDGDAHDAARVALIPLSQPYAAFADSPECAGRRRRAALDTLVVTAAGNDGPAGPGTAASRAPAARLPRSPSARSTSGRAPRAHVSSCAPACRRLLDARVPLAGAVAPVRRLAGRAPRRDGAGALGSLFDRHGFSEVAGRIALVPGGNDPAAAAEDAAPRRRDRRRPLRRDRARRLDRPARIRDRARRQRARRPRLTGCSGRSRPAQRAASVGAPRAATAPRGRRRAVLLARARLRRAGQARPRRARRRPAHRRARRERGPHAALRRRHRFERLCCRRRRGGRRARTGAPPPRRCRAAARPARLRAPTRGGAPPPRGTAGSTSAPPPRQSWSSSPPTLALGRSVHPGATIRRTITIESLSPRRISAFVGSTSRARERGGCGSRPCRSG